MQQFDQLVEEFQHIVPFRIRFKDERWEMQLLNLFVFWFNPKFLTHFTTVIGSTIYFPNRAYLSQRPESAMRTLAHEVVHILDMERVGFFPFMLGYGFPQIFALGIFLFPWIGLWALAFLIFAFPWPAPLRARYEARAYAIDLLTCRSYEQAPLKRQFENLFTGWDYYRMYPFQDQVIPMIEDWVKQIEKGEERDLLKVLLVYEMVAEN